MATIVHLAAPEGEPQRSYGTARNLQEDRNISKFRLDNHIDRESASDKPSPPHCESHLTEDRYGFFGSTRRVCR